MLHRAWPSRLAIGTDPAGRPVEVLTVVCDGVEPGVARQASGVRSTQNALPSGSVMTTHCTSP
ncbi:hypothetical protein GCM10025868_15270 [Angustibacter aerolatus]|uniref:Uncharacterized protein n=1 Tax=Angustibacter aerolatus TaxID=1162965 RepID=A0ABQ6JDK9_9ACTN|nr:hypothetical protein GCM10025868_15270 [Angustibacter aerolatus]